MGSAVLFFALQPGQALLGDLNPNLISTFKAVRDHPKQIHRALSILPLGKEAYYALRSQQPETLSEIDAAARFIFLNRFCFNGLYRTNLQGRFNVPYGAQRSGQLPSADQLISSSQLLSKAELVCADFETLLSEQLKQGDFVYLDPPYAQESRRVFKQYGENSFALNDLDRLRGTLRRINSIGAAFLLSYAHCPEAEDLLGEWPSRQVNTMRNISGFSKHRGGAKELIFTNILDDLGNSIL